MKFNLSRTMSAVYYLFFVCFGFRSIFMPLTYIANTGVCILVLGLSVLRMSFTIFYIYNGTPTEKNIKRTLKLEYFNYVFYVISFATILTADIIMHTVSIRSIVNSLTLLGFCILITKTLAVYAKETLLLSSLSKQTKVETIQSN